MANILIPDAPGGQVLAGMRTLHRDGDSCDLAWPVRGWRRRMRSRAMRRLHPIASAIREPDAYADDVARLLAGDAYDLVLPFGLAAHHALVHQQARLPADTPMAVPSLAAMEIANDKQRTAAHCRSLGVECPEIFEPSDDDVRPLGKVVRYPVVVKARSGSGVQRGLRFATDPESLVRAWEELRRGDRRGPAYDYELPIVQEYVPGHIHDACVLAWHGSVVNMLTQVRRLMYPIQGGVGAINETTRVPELMGLARRILESLDWHGPAQVEFKLDTRDGGYKLIEINPKLWGTLDLSIQAGMDFPRQIRDLILGRPVPRNVDYSVGLRYAFLFPQTLLAGRQLVRALGFGALRMPPAPHGTVTDIDWRDPLPVVWRAGRAAATLIRHGPVSVGSSLPDDLIPLPGDALPSGGSIG